MPSSSNHSTGGVPQLALNLSLLWKELPVRERLRRATAAGFRAVEFWWPFTSAVPSPQDIDEFADSIIDSGLSLVGLNLFAGDMPAGDRGVLSWPGREAELFASAEIARTLGVRLGTRRFNALYGNRLPDRFTPEHQDKVASENVRKLARLFSSIGATVMIEPVSGAPAYPLKTAQDVTDFIESARCDAPDAGILLDLYHLATNGDDVEAAIATHAKSAAHVQVADAPGRGIPGSGELPLAGWVQQLRRAGYRGIVALEFVGSTEDDPFEHFDNHSWENLA
ncbi:hydroxypyruvate isomerase family protein [Microbacterium rhizomatis]|uniref:TIM barrel protein n=1 Tax=Microbacterium rhizomatis TaxID=1631477 RepID=A0A5J5IYZ4_9MICO|nr:TIM barrel protein [Microbacterium rhizomatis]KAA9105873.1 TIM barrel protein [Microbacterium rhizomatis]